MSLFQFYHTNKYSPRIEDHFVRIIGTYKDSHFEHTNSSHLLLNLLTRWF